MAYEFPPIDPLEADKLSFDFALRLATAETLVTPTVTVTVIQSTDASASSRFGSPQVSGTKVLVPFSGCLTGVNYHVKVSCTTSVASRVLVCAATLPCRPE